MARPSFARYAALLAGVLDGTPADARCADAAPAGGPADGPDAGDAGRQALDAAARYAAGTLRRPSPAPPRARPSSLEAYRGVLAAPPPAPDVRLDRKG